MTPAREAAVVAEAMTWLKTPFHHRARAKRCGVDCANFLVAVFGHVGVVPADLDLGHYAPDWHLHHDEPRFLSTLKQYADPLPPGETPRPGDIAMFEYGRHAAHGAIVTQWPQVIHAWAQARMVVLSDADSGPLGQRLDSVWRLREVAA